MSPREWSWPGWCWSELTCSAIPPRLRFGGDARTVPGRREGARAMRSVNNLPVREPELRGRDSEVADLVGRISRLRDGHGGVLLIEGIPGGGTSRLALEARALAEAAGV